MVFAKIPQSFAMVQRLEAAIPNKIKMQLSEDKENISACYGMDELI
jgi:hypothetical protein